MIDLGWLKSQFPHIRNLAPLGSIGGQKCVFSGDHTIDGNIVLKLFHPQSNPDRAFREVRAPEQITSDRIPKIYEVGRVQSPIGQLIWIREQRISGMNLRQVLNLGPLDYKTTLKLGRDILKVLAASEDSDIVHRDVKPENIIIDTQNNAWLIDFGLSRHLDLASLTTTHALMGVGTFGYMPIEQYRNWKDEIDARADLFGLGVTLYECLEGKNPYQEGAKDISEVVCRIETVPFPPIGISVPGNQLRDLILSLTRMLKNHRPSTAADALEWISEICDREGI